jgi:hypothetical protein
MSDALEHYLGYCGRIDRPAREKGGNARKSLLAAFHMSSAIIVAYDEYIGALAHIVTNRTTKSCEG